jgi:hypothetical protein
MQTMTLQQTADYLEGVNISQTIDAGHAVIHLGTNAAGVSFVLVNDASGESTVSENL